MIRLLCILACMKVALCTTVHFELQMAVAAQNGLFNPATDSVCVHGDWSGWEGQGLWTTGDSLYHGSIELSQGAHEYKFVIHDGQELLWEEGANRSFYAQDDELQLPSVWFNDDSLACPVAAVEVEILADMTSARITGLFDPALQALTLRGAHPGMGSWGPGPQFESLAGELYHLQLELDSLSGTTQPWKLVLEDRDDPETVVWESGDDRELRRTCGEMDEDGNGLLELASVEVRFGSSGAVTPVDQLLLGLDNSWGPQMEAAGASWSDSLGSASSAEVIYRRHDFNLLRLRLWHTPAEAWQGLDSTLAHALRARSLGFQLLLDLHYSDTWADPGQQTPPAVWQGLDEATLADSVEAYTADVLSAFANADCLPQYLQLGNEINGGMLWPAGSVQQDTPAQWASLSNLLLHAMAGVDAVCDGEHRPQLLLHLAAGGQNELVRHFIDSLSPLCDFDVIALSWYPWWHGDLAALSANLSDLATRYGKRLLVVEHAYPFSLGWWDDCGNIVGLESQLLSGYPATPIGQAALAGDVLELIRTLPNGLGLGFCFWEPAVQASALCTGHENLSHFDALGRGLPVLDCLRRLAPPAPELHLSLNGGSLFLQWQPLSVAHAYRVEIAESAYGPWLPLTLTTSTELLLSLEGPLSFYRVICLD